MLCPLANEDDLQSKSVIYEIVLKIVFLHRNLLSPLSLDAFCLCIAKSKNSEKDLKFKTCSAS